MALPVLRKKKPDKSDIHKYKLLLPLLTKGANLYSRRYDLLMSTKFIGFIAFLIILLLHNYWSLL